MSDRDAFGNLIENDHPAATGLSGGDPLRPAPAPAPAATATAPPPPLPSFPPTPLPAPSSLRVKGSWDITDKLVGLFFIALFVVPLGIGGWFAYATWHDTAKPAISAIKNIQNGNLPATPDPGHDPAKPAAGPPRGLSARSLLKPAALDRVLASARRDPGGKLSLLRLAPDRADVQLARRGGGMDILQLRYDGGRSLVKTPGTPQPNTITFSTIDTHAPQRLVTAAAHRLRRSTKSIDYVVLIHVLGKPMWSAYFTGGAAFQGDAHGHITRRIQ